MSLLKLFSLLGAVLSPAFAIQTAVAQRPVVAITQIAPHPSLDQIRQGIVDELKDQGQDLDIRFDHASGDIKIATQIAQKFISLAPKVIVPITTPSTITVYQQAKSRDIPVVFAAVTDPVAAKLVDNKTHTGKGITGVSDLSPIAQQLKLIKTMQPHLKTIGVIYNPGEANSVVLITKFKELAKDHNLQVIEVGCSATKDIAQSVKKVMGGVDALYIPNDNTIISALDTVFKVVGDKLAIYAGDPESVERGCLACVAHSQYQIGRETGKLVVKVLKGEKPETLSVVTPENVGVTINRATAARLGISIPNTIENLSITYVGA